MIVEVEAGLVERGPVEMYASTTKRSIPRDLTDEEIAVLGREAAWKNEGIVEREGEIEDLKTMVSNYKRSNEETLKEIRAALSEIQAGARSEWIDCGVVRDVRSNRIGVIRLDTGAVVEVRAMYGEERQMSIEDAAAPDPSEEQIAKLDAWEAEHGRMAAVEPEEKEEDYDDEEEEEENPDEGRRRPRG